MVSQFLLGSIFLWSFLSIPNFIAENFKSISSTPFKWWYVVIAFSFIEIIFQFIGISSTYLIYSLATLTLLGLLKLSPQFNIHHFSKFNRSNLLFWLLLTPLLFYGITETAYNPVIEWDAVAIWFNKAKGFINCLTTNELPNSFYPNFGPAIWSIALKIVGLDQEPISRLIFFGFFIAWVGTLRVFLNNLKCTFVAILIAYSVFKSNHFTTGYQDGLIFIFLNLGIIGFVEFFKNQNVKYSHFSFLMCGTLASIKNEGAIVGLILVLLATFWSILVKKIPFKLFSNGIAFYFGTFSLPYLIKYFSNIDLLNFGSDSFKISDANDLMARINRIPTIFHFFWNYLLHERFLILPLLFISIAKFKPLKDNSFPLVFLTGHFVLIFFMFLMTNANLEWHLATAFNRLAFQANASIVVMAMLSISQFLSDFKLNRYARGYDAIQ